MKERVKYINSILLEIRLNMQGLRLTNILILEKL